MSDYGGSNVLEKPEKDPGAIIVLDLAKKGSIVVEDVVQGYHCNIS